VAAGHGGGGAPGAAFNHPALPPAPPLLIQGGEFSRRIVYLRHAVSSPSVRQHRKVSARSRMCGALSKPLAPWNRLSY
jgi:hypothetical protein